MPFSHMPPCPSSLAQFSRELGDPVSLVWGGGGGGGWAFGWVAGRVMPMGFSITLRMAGF